MESSFFGKQKSTSSIMIRGRKREVYFWNNKKELYSIFLLAEADSIKQSWKSGSKCIKMHFCIWLTSALTSLLQKKLINDFLNREKHKERWRKWFWFYCWNLNQTGEMQMDWQRSLDTKKQLGTVTGVLGLYSYIFFCRAAEQFLYSKIS